MGDDLLHHEGFHIYQYMANSPGFRYEGDSQWYIEATANWYAALKNTEEKTNYVTASAVTAIPYVPLWYSWENMEAGDKDNWQRGCHQYGMNVFLNYLTDARGIDEEILVQGFYDSTDQLPQEYLYHQLGGSNMSNLYADWAIHATAGFDYLSPGTAERSEKDLVRYGDSTDVHRIVHTFDNMGTGGNWYRPDSIHVTRNWGYNVYKIINRGTATYTFHLNGDRKGRQGTTAVFRARIVSIGRDGRTYYSLDMSGPQDGKITINADSSESEIYFVVAATPEKFSGNEKFSYRIKIDQDG